ncbi:MAG: hypothetical protein VZR27_05225 [Acutalibacteraceae bacterium]|nr:hypothetical protein [Clostridia bacterium]MEE3450087.1 hypothetical protein [Acutalibacteraceae bacterium]
MANYEELYYSARNKYNRAIDNRDSSYRRARDLENQRTNLNNQLSENISQLNNIREKKSKLQDALNKSREVLNNQYYEMQKAMTDAGGEYRKSFHSDMGTADLAEIYRNDFSATKNDLETTISTLQTAVNNAEQNESQANNSVNNCRNNIYNVEAQLRTANSDADAYQRMANSYYVEMKQYEAKWLNGE